MEGRRKEVLLLVLAVAALGIALYSFRGKPAPPPPGGTPVASEPGAAPAQGKVEESAVKEEGEQQAGASEEGSSEAVAGGAQRNPFSAPGASAAVGSDVAPEAGAEASAAPEPGMGPERAEPGGELGLTLTGIVDGKQTVAILRQNDQRYFVKVGDLVGDGYRVQSIGRQQVVLAGQQGKVILRMGGRQ
jgi:hypothetical protein